MSVDLPRVPPPMQPFQRGRLATAASGKLGRKIDAILSIEECIFEPIDQHVGGCSITVRTVTEQHHVVLTVHSPSACEYKCIASSQLPFCSARVPSKRLP